MLSRRALMAGAGAAALPLGSLSAATDSAFATLSRRWLDGTLALAPVAATALGDHTHDSALDDLSATGRAAASAFSRTVLAELRKIDPAGRSRAEQVDAKILENALGFDLWSRDTLREWAWNPLLYTDLAGQALYGLMARAFAPLPDRLRSATARIEKIPALWAQMRANLEPARVPSVHAETAGKQHSGVLSLAQDLVATQAAGLPPCAPRRLHSKAGSTPCSSRAPRATTAWVPNSTMPSSNFCWPRR
jgi:hypothetical protein